jgi:hypothetical protein
MILSFPKCDTESRSADCAIHLPDPPTWGGGGGLESSPEAILLLVHGDRGIVFPCETFVLDVCQHIVFILLSEGLQRRRGGERDEESGVRGGQ